MKRRIIVEHVNEVRTSRWDLIQQDDGTLHVEQHATDADGTKHRRIVPINDFMHEGGPPPRALQARIDRMFDDA